MTLECSGLSFEPDGHGRYLCRVCGGYVTPEEFKRAMTKRAPHMAKRKVPKPAPGRKVVIESAGGQS